jgi:hypothetical protein
VSPYGEGCGGNNGDYDDSGYAYVYGYVSGVAAW